MCTGSNAVIGHCRALRVCRAERPGCRLLDNGLIRTEANAHLSLRSDPRLVCRPLRQASPHSSHQQASLHHCAACTDMITIKSCTRKHKRRMGVSATPDQISGSFDPRQLSDALLAFVQHFRMLQEKHSTPSLTTWEGTCVLEVSGDWNEVHKERS